MSLLLLDSSENQNPYLNELKKLQLFHRIIFNLNNENIAQSVESIFDNFDGNYIYSFNIIISSITYSSFYAKRIDGNICKNFINAIETFEESKKFKSKIMDAFAQFFRNTYTYEAYLLKNKIEQIKFNYTEKTREQTNDNSEELSVYIQLIEEGINPNEIAKIIRNDEIEKLQEISSQANFDFNQTIEPSIYERCSFINTEYVTLIDYAAFFGSVKCFKFLLMNGAKVTNTGKYLLMNGAGLGNTGMYAIAGGNLEIIHLCEQNNSSFEYAYETAIQFHKNDIFKYLYENKIVEFYDLTELGKKCINYNNYEILLFLQENGMKINDSLIIEAAYIGNLYLVKYFLGFNKVPKNILTFLSLENIELFKFLLEQKGVDVNAFDVSISIYYFLVHHLCMQH